MKLIDISQLMERTPEGIQEAMTLMLEGINDCDDNWNDPVESLIFELTVIMLDWMGAGEVDLLDELLGSIRNALNKEAEDTWCVGSLSHNQYLAIELRCLFGFIQVYLTTTNLSKDLARLTNSDREVIVDIYKCPNTGLRHGKQTMERLAKFGLLNYDGVWNITWSGRSVAHHLIGDN